MSLPTATTLLALLAQQYLNSPYEWGGNGPFTFDCSGLVVKCLKDVNYDIPDMTSQQLYSHFISRSNRCSIEGDSLLFFGRNKQNISHVAIAVNDEWMIEAGGGDRLTRDISDAARLDARVRYKPIQNRKDLVASIYIGNLL